MHTFQDMILRLTHFWANEGCLFHQPYDLETGAATFNPITFLKVLGPEPYSAAYVEPCRRPQDGRYGQNPNRLQLFHQFQVILKPSPEDVIPLFLRSLQAIGFDLSQHDIRFVHDDWESPTQGAWGLGWEVWIDGMEVTQFTYFQAVGGVPLHPVTAEIAYGLERLSMLLQNRDTLFDMRYDSHLTYGELVKQNEIEWSTYNFEKSDPTLWSHLFNQYEKEAKRLLECELPIPAYDFVIKASHAFNMLEARGVISVTERTGYIFRIRDLAHLAALGYIQSREKLNFPLCKEKPLDEIAFDLPKTVELGSFEPKEPFLFEIGTEMLPAGYIAIGESLLRKAIEQLFNKRSLSYDRIESFASPQRLAILVHGLSTQTRPLKIEKKGPSIDLAFDHLGALTPQGLGFLKQFHFDLNLTKDQILNHKIPGLTTIQNGSHTYLFVQKESPSQNTFDLLKVELPLIIQGMTFPKNMRWGSYSETFARPIRWIVALLNQQVIPFSYAGVASSNKTRGHAQYAPRFFTITYPLDYASLLKEHYVIADKQERKAAIVHQLEKLEKFHQVKAVKKERVLNEVTHLVEWPKLVAHPFDSAFLNAPKELLVSEMVEHQRYFPVETEEGLLKNLFIMTLDHEPNERILDNNRKVLSARLSDGVFLYQQDLKKPLIDFLENLKTVTFHQNLGTVYQKIERLQKHSQTLHHALKIGTSEWIQRGATLCKADLATHLVKEFPELQGYVGKTYALLQKEPEEVAQAIQEHWLPVNETDPTPKTSTGLILSLADKLDNLLGYFSIGIKPSSSSDPYALRRQAFGVLKILIRCQLSLNLKQLLPVLFHSFSTHESPLMIDELIEFIRGRAKSLFEEESYKKDSIEAILSAKFENPYEDFQRLQAFDQFRQDARFPALLQVYKRLKGQVEAADLSSHINVELLNEPAEIALFETIQAFQPTANPLENFYQLVGFQPPLNRLFEEVKILCDEPSIRINRLALLKKVYLILYQFVDLSKVEQLPHS